MKTIRDFKVDLVALYSQALKHYSGNKQKAQACVDIYCKGLLNKNKNKLK